MTIRQQQPQSPHYTTENRGGKSVKVYTQKDMFASALKRELENKGLHKRKDQAKYLDIPQSTLTGYITQFSIVRSLPHLVKIEEKLGISYNSPSGKMSIRGEGFKEPLYRGAAIERVVQNRKKQGENIRERRKKLNLSQQDFAIIVGSHVSEISKIEVGRVGERKALRKRIERTLRRLERGDMPLQPLEASQPSLPEPPLFLSSESLRFWFYIALLVGLVAVSFYAIILQF